MPLAVHERFRSNFATIASAALAAVLLSYAIHLNMDADTSPEHAVVNIAINSGRCTLVAFLVYEVFVYTAFVFTARTMQHPVREELLF